ncbi:oligosaccharide flippase family protein [Agaribacter flavus]|uniref:Oligosaccharide flippase family protein n=1 Tax=Agaribacter flavus TaxID=1902781 RepID=A0ABV7FL26_9ALTE
MANVKKLFSASMLLSGAEVFRKMVGLVSTLILVRLLVPEDFGIIAIALLVMGFFDALKQLGGGAYLMRSKTINDDMINTTWTISFISNVFTSSMLIIFSPLFVSYYGDDRLQNILYVCASMFIVSGLANPGIIHLKRAQNYVPITKVSIAGKVLAVIISVTLAFTLKNYWALIAGQFTMAIVASAGSYIIHSHRPKFTLVNFKAQWSFSSWLWLQSLMGYGKAQLDTIIVSSSFSSASLGSYHTIKYLSSFPVTYFIGPATQPLLVQLSEIRDNKSYFEQQFAVIMIALFLFAAPIVGFMIGNHLLITEVFLGGSWTEYSILFAVFSISLISSTLLGNTIQLLIIDGNTRMCFIIETFSFVAIYSALLLLSLDSIQAFAITKVAIEATLATLFSVVIIVKYFGWKTLLQIFFQFALISIIVVLASITNAVVPSTLPLLVEALLCGLLFLCVYLPLTYTMLIVMKKRSRVWKYLFNLFHKFMQTLQLRLGRNKPFVE